MEASTTSDAKLKRGRESEQMMNPESSTNKPRTIIKAKRRIEQQAQAAKASESNEEDKQDEIEFEDSQEDEFEVEDVIQRHDSDDEGEGMVGQWEDCDDDSDKEMEVDKAAGQAEVKTSSAAPQVWDESKEPLKEGEELEYDGSAYVMLHRSKVEWPCLSIDYIIRERCTLDGFLSPSTWFPAQANGQLDAKASNTVRDAARGNVLRHKKDQFPMDVYMVAGSQAEKKADNRIYVMKWGEMHRTTQEDEECSDSEEEAERMREPVIRFEAISHRGGVNRIRSMHGTPIVATWTDEAEVSIYNIAEAIEELDKPVPTSKKQVQKKKFGGCKIASFKHKQEGYALDWSPNTFGRLAAGSNDASLNIFKSTDETCSTFVKEFAVGLQGHKRSIEDIQWSPSQDHVLATCSSDTTIKLWDLRATQLKPVMSWVASDCDINVISWNNAEATRFLLASGDDKGEIRIWDMRMLQPFMGAKKAEIDPITQIHWHTDAITSLQFEPREESVLAVTSADNKMTLWDFSVEIDETEEAQEVNEQLAMQIPPQMMFLHQGQKNMKEIRFHPQYQGVMATTAEDSFNMFKPNLEIDPLDEDDAQMQTIQEDLDETEETKQASSAVTEESKR